MDQLIAAVTSRTGLSEEQAKAAAEAVIGFLKEHLPAPGPELIAKFTSGGAPAGNAIGQAVEGFFKKS